jgi:hypothetical protein
MSNLFRNSNPGALTREQAVELEVKRLAERRRQKRHAEELAAQGRGEDTEIAHLAPGEFVVPEALQTPEFMAALRHAAADRGISLEMLRVGSTGNQINPNTGTPEFGLLSGFGDWFSRTFGAGTANAAPASTSAPANSSSEVAMPDQVPMEEIVVSGSLITDDPSTNRMIEGLHPSLRYDAARFINAVKDRHGRQLRIPDGSGHRTFEEQDALYAKGRTTSGDPVTPLRGGESYHNYGLGFDVAPLNSDGRTPNYKIDLAPFAPIAKEHGLEWGGNFKSHYDPLHYQRTYGYSADQLRQMMEQDGRYPAVPGQRKR